MSQDQLRDGECGGESFRRAYPHGRDHLSPTRAQCPGVFDGVLPCLLWGDSGTVLVTTNNWLARKRAAVHLVNGYLRCPAHCADAACQPQAAAIPPASPLILLL